VFDVFAYDLMRLRLYEAIRAIYFRININIPTFYAILEIYFPALGTFFTLVGELGMALYEI